MIHLCFADELIIFIRGDLDSVLLQQRKFDIFDIFSEASGLKANLTEVYFEGVKTNVQNDILQALGYEKGGLPLKYLGVHQLKGSLFSSANLLWEKSLQGLLVG